MISLIAEKLAELEHLCARYRVRRLALFGSATGGDFDPQRSDLDLVVDFEPLSPAEHSAAYFGLWRDLQTLFDREVDLIEYAPIDNPYFLRSLLRSQVLLYDAA